MRSRLRKIILQELLTFSVFSPGGFPLRKKSRREMCELIIEIDNILEKIGLDSAYVKKDESETGLTSIPLDMFIHDELGYNNMKGPLPDYRVAYYNKATNSEMLMSLERAIGLIRYELDPNDTEALKSILKIS